MKDSILQSFIRGRGLAAVLAVVSVVLSTKGVTIEEQTALKAVTIEAAQVLTGLGAAAVALISKFRE
jgi:hypothetical protein